MESTPLQQRLGEIGEPVRHFGTPDPDHLEALLHKLAAGILEDDSTMEDGDLLRLHETGGILRPGECVNIIWGDPVAPGGLWAQYVSHSKDFIKLTTFSGTTIEAYESSPMVDHFAIPRAVFGKYPVYFFETVPEAWSR